MFLKYLFTFFKALNSNTRAWQLASGAACGLLLALVPAGNLLWITLFLLTFFTKIHFGLELLVMALCKLLLLLFSPLLDSLGWAVLHIAALEPFYTWLYNVPVAPLTRFNNTLVAGGLVAGLVLWLPVFFLMLRLIPLYRTKLAPMIVQSKAWKAFLKFPIVKTIAGLVSSASKLYGAM